jgi:hypothetical protein
MYERSRPGGAWHIDKGCSNLNLLIIKREDIEAPSDGKCPLHSQEKLNWLELAWQCQCNGQKPFCGSA